MNRKIAGIIARISELERELEQEIEREAQEKTQEFQETHEKGKNLSVRPTHPPQKSTSQGILSYLRETPLTYLILAPVFYSFYLPLLLLDLWIWLFQSVCFRALEISRVKRSLYVVLDRGHLPYLNWIEQFNCNYCGYANGLIAYAREVAARTEQFFCPIKHARRIVGIHSRYRLFFEFGDGEGYKKGYEHLRKDLKE